MTAVDICIEVGSRLIGVSELSDEELIELRAALLRRETYGSESDWLHSLPLLRALDCRASFFP